MKKIIRRVIKVIVYSLIATAITDAVLYWGGGQALFRASVVFFVVYALIFSNVYIFDWLEART